MNAYQNESQAREAVLNAALETVNRGLNSGTSGNVSLRWGEGLLITPSGMLFDRLGPQDLAFIDLQGQVLQGQKKPSSEWQLHCTLYRERDEFDAIVHTHSVEATAWSCLRKPIPSFHYMVAALGGREVPCADYATFGTHELAENAQAAMNGYSGCLLGNHGVLAAGPDFDLALERAELIEILAQQYMRTLQMGGAVMLPDAEMDRVLEAFKGYGAHAQSTSILSD